MWVGLIAFGCDTPGGGRADGGTTTDASPTSDGSTQGVFDWSARAPLSIPRTEVGVAAIGGKFYVMGGYSGSLLARVDEYDPVTDTWQRKADMHAARRDFAVAVIGGKIYITGGMAFTDYNNVQNVASTESYDPATDTWTDHAPAPLGASGNGVWGNFFSSGAALNGLFYLVIYNAFNSPITSQYVYDPGTDGWTNRPGGNFGTGELGAAALDGILYVIASGGPVASVSSYDPNADLWIVRPPVPDTFRASYVAAGGKLYSLGGDTGTLGEPMTSDLVEQYDPMTTQWTGAGHMRVAREYAGAAEINGTICVFGGDTVVLAAPSVPTNAVECGVPR